MMSQWALADLQAARALLATIKAAIEAHDIETESAEELRGLLRRIHGDVSRELI